MHFRAREFGPDSTKVIFFFTILNTKVWLYRLPIKRLIKNGYKVVAYDYSGRLVLKGDVKKFLEVNYAIQKDVLGRVKTYEQSGVQTFHCLGASIGTIFAVACTANISSISKVVINLTYGSLAENVWTWWYLTHARRKLIKQGLDMHALEKMLEPISPIPNARKLKDKQVLLYLARRDKVLRHSQSSQFKVALEKAGATFEYHENRWLGHIASIFMNFWRWRTYIDFLTREKTS